MNTTDALDADALDQLFLQARSQNGWQDKAVGDDILAQLYALVRMGPTEVVAGIRTSC